MCYLPPALLAEWPRSSTCHCGNMGMRRKCTKNQNRKITLRKKIVPPLTPGIEPANFQSWVRRWAIPPHKDELDLTENYLWQLDSVCVCVWGGVVCWFFLLHTEMKVQSGENTELKHSPFKAVGKYSHSCYAYCHGFLPCSFYPSGPFTCIFPKPLPSCSCVSCG